LDVEQDQHSRHEPEGEGDEAEDPFLADHRWADECIVSKPCESHPDPGIPVI